MCTSYTVVRCSTSRWIDLFIVFQYRDKLLLTCISTQISFITLLSMLGTASSIGAVSFLNPPGGAAHSRRGTGGGGKRHPGVYRGSAGPGAGTEGEALLSEGIGGADTWEGLHAGHTSVRWHGTGTAKRERCAGSAVSRSTTRSRHQAQIHHGNLTTCSRSTCGLTSSLT